MNRMLQVSVFEVEGQPLSATACTRGRAGKKTGRLCRAAGREYELPEEAD